MNIKNLIKHDLKTFDRDKIRKTFQTNNPVPWYVFPEFLSDDVVSSLKNELDHEYTTNKDNHKIFTRAGSNMFEILDNHEFEHAENLISAVHSKTFISFLEDITGIKGLISDPSLVGAGYMRC